MEREPSPDVDDDFDDIYKEYTGPPGSNTAAAATAQEKPKVPKRSHTSSDEEDETRDPNAVPTDFTSREAKVWEAKSKATERNWKKRKEEEMICKICGESGHFTQGCPSTLGANRKTQDFFERVAARDSQVRALFTEKVIQRIEKDIGCKIKMDEKFIIVSGKDRLCLSKGVDAVHKVKEEGNGNSKNQRGSTSSRRSRSRSPADGGRAGSRTGRSEPPRSSGHSPRKTTQLPQKFGRPEKVVEEHIREDVQKFSRGSPRARAFRNGVRGRSSHSRSPGRPPYANNAGSNPYDDRARVRSSHSRSPGRPPYANNAASAPYGDGARVRSTHSRSPGQPTFASNAASNPYDGHTHVIGSSRPDGWNIEKRVPEVNPGGGRFEFPAYPKTLEELELEYKREAMELSRARDNEEDEENYKHREHIREMRENYMKKMAIQRGMHAKQWEEFLQLDIQRREQQAARQLSLAQGYSTGGSGRYGRPGYQDYDPSAGGNAHYGGASLPAVAIRDKYPYPVESYTPSRAHDVYSSGDFQRQRHEDYGKTYNRY
ncbi:uncharacterized protein LOC113333137 isoform X1 [Papaver somniferum]|uniref:uncharacterized protein LOC113333137 isoform X1 n=1 Tax=Papaver somniferum TaxID=3469 RepID=UPI000E6FCC42|nr:uncharacterized protein LOC113333137 isoform X1 [Papaver somniferum]